MTLKLRLAIWYGALFAVVLGVALVAAYTEHSNAHLADDDAALDAAWRSAAPAASRMLAAGGDRDALLHELLDASDVGLVLVDANGGIIANAHRAPLEGLATVAAAAPDGYSSAAVASGHLRLFARSIDGAPGVRLVAAMSLDTLDTSLARLRGYLLLLGVVGLAVAVSGGLAISGSALRPIALVTETARSIAASRAFSRRVAVPSRDDEVGRLARTFNRMLDALEDAYSRQQRFVGEASHELRTPLAAIRTHVELLARGGGNGNGDGPDLLHRVEREVERLCGLVDQLLILSRADAGDEPFVAAEVQLDEVVMEVFEGRQAQDGSRLSVVGLDVAPVAGERDRLVQLLLILIDNALRYTPDGGQVTVALTVDAEAAEVRVEDDGIGIDPAERARLFDRFYRGAAARQVDPTGSGLGLAIAKWIVERHGGEIRIEPRTPRGTRAIVRLPLAARALVAAEA